MQHPSEKISSFRGIAFQVEEAAEEMESEEGSYSSQKRARRRRKKKKPESKSKIHDLMKECRLEEFEQALLTYGLETPQDLAEDGIGIDKQLSECGLKRAQVG